MQQQLINPFHLSPTGDFLEIPQSGLIDLAPNFSSERVLPTLPLLPLRRRRDRKAVRSKQEIELAILDSCRIATVQHWIMVKARLGYDTFWKHMNKLLSSGLMDEVNEGSRTLYRINAKGLKLLSQHSI
ncbi:MAG: winged helix-turn-helix domain-containing protein [Thaumarchaeota archaeon]|nr:winged helix-turn-helix domain-containing protein [Nitrososphaerota archaeon]